MANYANLIATIKQYIKANGNNEITGQMLQEKLLEVIGSLGIGFQYMGVALPTTRPGDNDNRMMYFATETGRYTYFGDKSIAIEGVYVLTNPNGVWRLDTLVTGGGSSISVDSDLSKTSTNPVQNKAIATEIEQMKNNTAAKQDKLVSGTNIKSVNGNSLLGSGDIKIEGGSGVTVDDKLDSQSTNPVQNKVVTNRILGLATQVEGKQSTLVSGESIKTVNGNSLLGSGNIDISGGAIKNDTFNDDASFSVSCQSNVIHSGSDISSLTIGTSYDSTISSDGSEEVFIFSTDAHTPNIQITGVWWNNGGLGEPTFAADTVYKITIKFNKTLGIFLCDVYEYIQG